MLLNTVLRRAGAAHSSRRANSVAVVIALGTGLAGLSIPAASAAGVGDGFDNPRLISRSTGVDDLIDTTGFTAEAAEPGHGGRQATHSAWFKWQSPATGVVTFRTKDTNFDTVLSAYTGDSFKKLSSVGENDDVAFNDETIRQSQVRFTATAGVTYRIAVDGFRSTDVGKVILSWDANDSFSGATPLSGPAPAEQLAVRTDNTGAIKEAGEPDHAGFTGGHSVWFRWTAPASGKAEFAIGRGQVRDTLLAAYTGNAVNTLTKVAANDDRQPGLGVSAISFAAVKGTTYSIAVDGKHPVTEGALDSDEGEISMGYSLTPTPGPSLSVADVTVTEGDSGLKAANLTVKLSKAATTDVTVNAFTPEGTAKTGSDFVARNAKVTIPRGSTSIVFPVQVVGDTLAEPNESFSVALSGPTGGATIGDGSATVAIADNDAPKLSIVDATVTEGNSGTKNVTLTVQASKASAQQMSVKLSALGDTAKNGSDFTAFADRALGFAPGQTSRTTTVAIVGDLVEEAKESFKTLLSSPTGGAVIADGNGLVTVTDND